MHIRPLEKRAYRTHTHMLRALAVAGVCALGVQAYPSVDAHIGRLEKLTTSLTAWTPPHIPVCAGPLAGNCSIVVQPTCAEAKFMGDGCAGLCSDADREKILAMASDQPCHLGTSGTHDGKDVVNPPKESAQDKAAAKKAEAAAEKAREEAEKAEQERKAKEDALNKDAAEDLIIHRTAGSTRGKVKVYRELFSKERRLQGL